ncbi:hypothetical protein Dsin_032278 [Dipteronia sinensis]|uniref:Uncharacterized protein n=1 Tax=Dipteronia sinensis TaxID=43782 RepID=A0AAD9ZN24_9ROSI|nr:hypothetical protein Dsin_032278 [Dipteronia sinensis]
MMNTFSEIEIEVARQLMQFCRELRDLKKTKHEVWRTIINDNHEVEEEEENDDESKGSNKEALSNMIEDEEGEYGNGNNGNMMMRPIRKRRFRSMEFIYKSTEPLVKLVVSDDNAYKKRIKCNY